MDPGGSALEVDEVIVAELSLPWPKPVWNKVGFQNVPIWADVATKAGRKVRVLAAVPESGDGAATIWTHSRQPGDALFTCSTHRVDPAHEASLLERLLVDGLESSPDTMVREGRTSDGAPRELLVCTQGSHDVCCGTHGTAFAAAMASAEPTLNIRRISHTGGHRFAPTAMSMPDGRMWGLIDSETMMRIVQRLASPAEVAGFCRGWSGVAQGPAQVAERAVMEKVDDWSFDLTVRQVEVFEHSSDRATCVVKAAEKVWRVALTGGREVPVISCGAAGGLPAKSSREWIVAGVELVD